MSSVGVQLHTVNNDNAYPRPYFRIGDILESTNPNNPSNDGYIGTWELYGKGRVTVCIDTDDNNFNIVNKEIGENTHTLTVDEMPSHNHKFKASIGAGSWEDQFNFGNNNNTSTMTSYTVGGDRPHNNIQKSIVVYRWRRIA